MIRKQFFLFFWVVLILIFFFPIFQGKIPAPLDTIVGLYHPWRDNIWDGYTAGVPYKNFLITDPVRQQIPYRFLAIESLKRGYLASWNPYSFSGTPLSSNIQSAVFYPLNVLFLFLPFTLAWTVLIILSPFLGGLFLYLYLRFLKLEKISCFLGALTFSFSGFFIAWLEWGTITHVVLWLPLILLAVENLIRKISLRWLIILFFAQVSQLLAGHLQVSFYVLIFSIFYLIVKILQNRQKFFKKSLPFIILGVIIIFFVSIQYISLFKLIMLSARGYDLPDWQVSSWFIPWQHLIQFIAPDFFGNPATLNYWGDWNYGEFVGYVGVIPLLFVLYAIFARKDKKSLFYTIILIINFILITPNPVAKLPFILKIPFLNTGQPTRLLSLIVFSLAVLSALGFDWFIKDEKNKKNIFKVIILFFIIICFLLGFIFIGHLIFNLDNEVIHNLHAITKRNLLLPTLLILLSLFLSLIYLRFNRKIFSYLFLLISILDLFRFGRKFIPFSNSSWFYPSTKIIKFLQDQKDPFRFLSIDRKIFPPNFSIMYKLENVSGYDPLYLLNYAKLVQAWENDSPNINLGRFNRIITPQNFESFINDLLNVRYILSLSEINSEKLILKVKEGETKLYENTQAFPRAFLTEKVRQAQSEDEEIRFMFEEGENLRNTAITKENIQIEEGKIEDNEKVEIIYRDENYIKMKIKTNKKRLVVLSEIYYPSWRGYVDGVEEKIYCVDLSLRGMVIPKGEHLVEMKYKNL